MTVREIRILALLTGAMLLLTVLAHQFRHASSMEGIGELWLEGLDVNAVSRIELVGGGERARVSLVLGDAGWGVEQRRMYPAEISRIRRLLLDLSEAKVVERKTDDPEQYAQLGLRDIAHPDARGVLLKLTQAGEVRVLRLGNQPAGRTATYVRAGDDDQCWTVNREIAPAGDPAQWLRPQLLDLPADKVQRVRVAHADGETVEGARDDGGGALTPRGLPAGAALKDAQALLRIANAATALELRDVLPEDEAPEPDGDAARVEFEMLSGYTVRAQLFARGEAHYARFTVQQSKRMSAKARADATALEQRVRGWVFQIPSFAYTSMTVRWSDLTESEGDAAAG